MGRVTRTEQVLRSHNRDRVAELMAAGQTTRQIARLLGIKEHLVWKLWSQQQERVRASSRLNALTVKAQRRSHLEFLLSVAMRYVTTALDPAKFAASGMTHRDFQGYVAEASRINSLLVRLDALEGSIAPPVNPMAGPNEGNLLGEEADNSPRKAREILDFIYRDGDKHPELVKVFQKYYPPGGPAMDEAAKEMYDDAVRPESGGGGGGGTEPAAKAEAAAGQPDVPEPGGTDAQSDGGDPPAVQ